MAKSARKTPSAGRAASKHPSPPEPRPGRDRAGTDDSAPIEFRPVDESTVRRPFAATLDLQGMDWRFLGPVAGAAAALFPSGPEAAIRTAVRAVVEAVLASGRVTPGQLAAAGLRFLHLSGRASAAELGQQLFGLLVRSYLESARAAGPGQAVEVRPAEGSRIELHFGPDAAPSLPPAAADPGPLATLPTAALTVIRTLRGSLAPYHAPVVGLVQQLLDSFAGKHAATLAENKAVAAAVNDLAEDHGVALVYNGEPVTLRVVPVRRDPAGSFQARRIGSDQRILKTSMAFPPLTAVSKANLADALATREADAADPAAPE